MKNTISIIFFVLTLTFIAVSMINQHFLDWVFERHHNQWSWYIRPLFLIPFCYFAFKRNLTGISITIFCLFTSMFWFNKPLVVNEQITQFLQFEKDWLHSEWDINKILSVLAIPLSLYVLALAFWKRSLLIGLGIIAIMATGKVIWSIQNAGESGKSIIYPAILGFAICAGFIFLGYRKLKHKK